MRIKNYIKNVLIFIPFIFSGKFLVFDSTYITLILGVLAFCLTSSMVYIINDLKDLESDKLDVTKKKRPLAAGLITTKQAIFLLCCLGLLFIILNLFIQNIGVFIISVGYIVLNVLYSVKLKYIPVVDITVLSVFYLIRIYYGGFLVNCQVSVYLYLTVLCFAYMMGTDKRKVEMKAEQGNRKVLKQYTFEYLDVLSYIFMSLTIVFYALWLITVGASFHTFSWLLLSIFILIFILMYYQYLMTLNRVNGNPVDVVFEDKLLVYSVVVYLVVMLLHYITFVFK